MKNDAESEECDQVFLNNIQKPIEQILELETDLTTANNNSKIKINYLQLIKNHLDDIVSEIATATPYMSSNIETYIIQKRIDSIINLFREDGYFKVLFNNLKFTTIFLKKLNFLSSNMVAIGANGSGKSSLSENLKQRLPTNGVVISAQKILIIPTFSSIPAPKLTEEKLTEYQKSYINFKSTYDTHNGGTPYSIISQIGNNLQILLENLLAQRAHDRNVFCDQLITNPNIEKFPPITTLDKVIEIWNQIILHRKLTCDSFNIYLETIEDTPQRYAGYLMSDGEKVTLYYISYILQAPKNGFIIIDEPEMYLNKNVLSKLWNKLEEIRDDCIFMYLTHDIDFAKTRSNAQKIWIKSFNHPQNWDIEQIPNSDELPENLILELLGSRQNILFCESKTNKNDEIIYNILFPNFTIKPVESCKDVINYTKAFNKLNSLNTKAFGLIDSDHTQASQIQALKNNNIFCLKVSEIENLFFDEEFLIEFANFMNEENVKDIVQKIKDEVISKFNKQKDIQVSNYICTKINNFFNNSHIKEMNTKDDISKELKSFLEKIDVDEFYKNRLEEVTNIINEKNYSSTIRIFNNKGLKEIANKHFNIGNFPDRALSFFKKDIKAQNILKKYFDESLISNGCANK